jgi:RND family efflux transporter MFP subunit
MFFCALPLTAKADSTVRVPGLTEPLRDVLLSFDVDGTIGDIRFKEGDRVKKGDTLIELRKGYEELQVRQSKMIWDSKVELDSAKVRSDSLKQVYLSTQALFDKTTSVSKEELEKKKLEYELAEAEYQRLAVAEKKEEMEYRMAVEKRDKLILRSPISGTITKLLLDEGESCENRQPVAHVVDTGECIIVCNVEAALAQNLHKGQAVNLSIPVGFKSVSVTGRLIFVSPVVDKASGLVMVKAQFDNPGGSVRPGVAGAMFVPVKSKK